MSCNCRKAGTVRQSWVVLVGDREHEFSTLMTATRFAREHNYGAPIHRINQETTT